MSQEEQHELLCSILCRLVPILDGDELSLLAHSCGIRIDEFYGSPKEQAEVLEVIEWRKVA